MKTVLLINSFASASQIGGSVAEFALRRIGLHCFFLPTCLVGRHPGWGDPGMVDVAAADMTRMFAAITAQGLLPEIDAVLTGYFRTPEQVQAATTMIRTVQAANPSVQIAVDPVMGDAPKGLYVPEAVACAIRDELLPLAHMLTPNGFELEFLGRSVSAIAEVYVTSGARTGQWRHELVLPTARHAFETPRRKVAPNGTGDLLASLILAHRLLGAEPETAFSRSIHAVQQVLNITEKHGCPELALEAAQDVLAGGSSLSPLNMSKLPAKPI